MQEKALLFLTKWFYQYVQSFYSGDEQLQFHVRLKEEHTLRVMNHAADIAKWLTLTPKQQKLAQIAGLLHDIGRFKQYQTYRTFNDGLSVNHAELGLEVLEQSHVLQTAGLSRGEQETVKQAVLYHNRRQLDPELEQESFVLAQITRDADKLDIFSMLVTKDQANKVPHAPELKLDTQYSPHIIEEILQDELIKPKDINNSADLMLFRLSWIYDINFAYSFSYILQKKYVEQIVATLPDTKDIQHVYQHILQYIDMQIRVQEAITSEKDF